MRRLLPRRLTSRVLVLILLLVLIAGLFFAPHSTKPAQAQGCAWGDIICDMKAALQQLIDDYVTPMQWWAYLQFHKVLYTIEYSIARTVASFMWGFSKMLTTVGVGIGVLSQWIAENFFTPMIQMTSETMQPIVGVFFFMAFVILGITYLLATFVRLNVVSPRNMIMWWIAGALFFSVGPSIYLSMRNLQQGINSLFYASSLDAISTNPFQNLAASDPAAASPIYQMTPLCSNFTTYISGSAGKINGIDVSLAFQKGDGLDVVTGGDGCTGDGAVSDLPRKWFLPDGFFEFDKAPDTWDGVVECPDTGECNYELLANTEVAKMQESVNRAFAGVTREVQSIPLVWFAIVEQLVGLCLVIAQGLTFVSFACAILFAFFRRTEPVAWAIVDQWLSLLVQSVVIALIQGMTIALYIAASESGSPLVSMAVSVVALVMMILLLFSGFKAIWSAFNKLFEAFGQASGGTVMSLGEAGSKAAGLGMAVASGGASLATGTAALAGGATVAQAAGVAFGGSKALDGAASTMARLPGVRDTALGGWVDQFQEGTTAQQAGKALFGAVPMVGGALGRLGGAALGASLLTDRNPDNAEAVTDQNGNVTWKAPPLRKSVTGGLNGALTDSDGESVRRGDVAESAQPTSRVARGTFTPVIDNGEGVSDEIMEKSAKDAAALAGSRGADSGGGLSNAANSLTAAANALNVGASTLQQAGANRPPMEAMTGYTRLNGTNNVAEVMSRTIDNLRQQNRETGQEGASNERVSKAMAGAMGVTPVVQDNGREVAPIEERANRFQMFTDQALRSGISGSDAAQVLREVKASPDGKMQPETRDRLLREQREEHGQSWSDSVQNIQMLESTAKSVPGTITAYGTRVMPADTTGSVPISLVQSAGYNNRPVTLTPPAAVESGQATATPVSAALGGMQDTTPPPKPNKDTTPLKFESNTLPALQNMQGSKGEN